MSNIVRKGSYRPYHVSCRKILLHDVVICLSCFLIEHIFLLVLHKSNRSLSFMKVNGDWVL